MPAARAASQAAVIDRVAAQHDSLLAALVRFIVRRLESMEAGAWYDDRAVRVAAVELAAQVRSAQGIVANLHSEAMLQALHLEGVSVKPEPVRLSPDLRGIDEADVWERPAKEFRRQKALGLDDREALDHAVARAELIAGQDVDLAAREGARQRIERSPAIGYRRVLRPELSAGGTCGLCIVAADRLYHAKDLMPIHDRCKCRTMPVLHGADPGQQLNAADLAKLYAAAGGSTSGAALKRTRYKVDEHGELGPVLTAEGQRVAKWSRNAGERKHAEEVERTRRILQHEVETLPARIEEMRAAGNEQQAASAEKRLAGVRSRLKRLDAAN